MVVVDHREMEDLRQRLGLSVPELWLGYVALGGSLTVDGVEGYLAGTAEIGHQDYDILAVALNEALIDAGLNGTVPYAED